jgi:hypothetical protein
MGREKGITTSLPKALSSRFHTGQAVDREKGKGTTDLTLCISLSVYREGEGKRGN